jgi:predicted ATP-grasp superfamily ATP-dependent carboligase
MIPALIIDRGDRIELGTTRLLGAHGVPVHLLLPRGLTPAAKSRWCSAHHTLPSQHSDETALVSAIADIAARVADAHGERPVMLFTWERFLLLAARHRERLEPVLRLDLPEREPLERCIDKRRFAADAEAAGLPVPRSVIVSCPGDVEPAASLGLPVFVKPPTNMSWGDLPERLGIAQKGVRVGDHKELEKLLAAILSDGKTAIVQESVEGPDYGHASIHSYRHPMTGQVLGVCTIRRARVYPAGAGLGCFLLSEDLPELVAPSLKALETFGLTGTSSVQWKWDERREWRILEIGPRVALSMGIGDAAGVNIPWVAYRSLLGLELDPPRQRYGMAWLDLAHDRVSLRTYLRSGEWTLPKWLWSLRSVRAWAFFSLKDPKPWLHQLWKRAANRLRKTKTKANTNAW